MVGGSVTEWLQLLVGGGIGLNGVGGLEIANPVFTPKLLLWEAADDCTPGLAVAAGITLPATAGEAHEEAVGFFLFTPITSRLLDDHLAVHLNLGARGARLPGGEVSLRPYWGLGTEAALFGHDHPHLVLEVYAGDPFHPVGPSLATQGGFRWLLTDHVNIDLTFGAQSDEEGGVEWWGQLGLRLLFDAFTPGGRPGNPQGARGLLAPPGQAQRRPR